MNEHISAQTLISQIGRGQQLSPGGCCVSTIPSAPSTLVNASPLHFRCDVVDLAEAQSNIALGCYAAAILNAHPR
ncbi:hypothetical protein [Synechococcus phage Ssp-JY38]